MSHEVKSGHGLLLMQRWNYGALEAAVKHLCEETTGRTWGDVANRIGRHLPWEFDYRYDKYQDEGRAIE